MDKRAVKDATSSDLNMIVECHLAAFPNALSSRLGQKVSRKAIEWYLADRKRFLFWIEVDGRCAGYAGGMISDGSQVHGSASGMIQYAFREVFVAVLMRPWLWFHGELVSRYPLIVRNLFYKVTGFKKPLKDRINLLQSDPATSLVVIGVHPEFQGKGIATRLLQAFEERTISLGIFFMKLSVLRANTRAIRSYEKNGWKIDRQEGDAIKMEKKISPR